MMRTVFAMSLAWSLVAAPVLAAPATQAPARPAGLTLAQAVQTALSAQPQLRQAQADVASAQASARQTQAGLYPSVSVSTGYSFGPSRQNINQVGVPVTNLGNYALSASADQLLYDFGQTGNRARAAATQAEAQAQTAVQTRQNVLFNVRNAYFTARANQTLVQVAAETLANQQRHLRQTQDLVKIGSKPPIDVAQATKDVANARLGLINATSALETAKAQLNQAMGVERGTDYTLADEAMGPVAGEDQPLETLMAEAVAHRPDLAAIAGRIEAQSLTVAAAEHSNYPSLRASAGAGTNGTPISNPNNNWSLGVGLSWPLYSGGAREAQADQARAQLASLQAQADGLRLQLRLTVEQARLAVVSAKAAVQAAAEARKSARVQLDLAEGRYAAGVGSVIELADAQLAYTNARAQAVQESYKLATARAQLTQALGRE